MATRAVKIGKRDVVFSSKRLKSGETAYYRGGKRAKTKSQIRIAKNVLAGQSYAQATGRKRIDLGEYDQARLTAVEIASQEEFHLGDWAAPARNDREGKVLHDYYMKISVTSESMRKVGSDPDEDGEGCAPATLLLLDPRKNTQTGFLFVDIANRFEEIALFTIERSRLTLCHGSLEEDLLGIWRHTTR